MRLRGGVDSLGGVGGLYALHLGGGTLLGHLPRGELRKLRYAGAEDSHLDYLRKMGFTARGGDYEKELETAEKEEAK